MLVGCLRIRYGSVDMNNTPLVGEALTVERSQPCWINGSSAHGIVRYLDEEMRVMLDCQHCEKW